MTAVSVHAGKIQLSSRSCRRVTRCTFPDNYLSSNHNTSMGIRVALKTDDTGRQALQALNDLNDYLVRVFTKCTLPEISKFPLAFVPLPFRFVCGVVRLNRTSGAILACWK